MQIEKWWDDLNEAAKKRLDKDVCHENVELSPLFVFEVEVEVEDVENSVWPKADQVKWEANVANAANADAVKEWQCALWSESDHVMQIGKGGQWYEVS